MSTTTEASAITLIEPYSSVLRDMLAEDAKLRTHFDDLYEKKRYAEAIELDQEMARVAMRIVSLLRAALPSGRSA